MESIGTDFFSRYFRYLAETMENKRDELCVLDAELGDGDIGLTMSKGFRAVYQTLQANHEDSPGAILKTSALTLMNVVPSTMGTLLAGGFLEFAKATGDAHELDWDKFARAFHGFINGIEKRGKAVRGDKTILDSLYPALDILKATEEKEEIFKNMSKAARAGFEATVGMVARFGRAARHLDGSVGHYDAGAAVGVVLVEGFEHAHVR